MRRIKRTVVVAVLVSVVAVAGCIGSVRALYETEDDLVYDESLLGEWRMCEGAPFGCLTVRFSPYQGADELAEHLYEMRLEQEERALVFKAGLVPVGEDRLVLDLLPRAQEPAPDADALDPLFWLAHMPLHTPHLFERPDEQTFHWLPLEMMGLGHFIKQRKDQIGHLLVESTHPERRPDERQFVLNDEPKAVRALLAAFLDEHAPADVAAHDNTLTFEKVADPQE